MGKDTCVYVYVPWQIQKRGVLELALYHGEVILDLGV